MDWPKDDVIDTLRKELTDFQKCVKGNHLRLMALCDVSAIDGHYLDSVACKPVSVATCQSVMREAVHKIVSGMKVDGKDGNWSCGFLGSRWFDLAAETYDCAYIRCAFYSRKHYKGRWPVEQPYMLRITIEKTEVKSI